MLQIQRQLKIKEYLVKNGFASVEELSDYFHVSGMTIRRDLDELNQQGLIQRTYGGAMDNDIAFYEMSVQAKISVFAEEKARIGKAASTLIKDNETIFLDSGTTILHIATNIKDKKLTVITNALNIAIELSTCPEIEILVAGGILMKGPLNTVGPQTSDFIKDLRVDKVFLGIEGVDPDSGISVPDPIEASNKQVMMRIARESIIVADHSKIGRTTTSSISPIEDISLVITDKDADPEVIERIKQKTTVMLV